ncbi:MAG: hypothetical protein KDI11_09330 [Alphaproteobacteria bacterium]|nr:hypothetical protein [Alphaproteobacteria bacterium]
MTSLAEKLSDIVGAAFAAQGLPVELGAVRVSDRPDLCQFQCNGAMAAAKLAKKNPREVAQGVVEVLKECPSTPSLPPVGGGGIRKGGFYDFFFIQGKCAVFFKQWHFDHV